MGAIASGAMPSETPTQPPTEPEAKSEPHPVASARAMGELLKRSAERSVELAERQAVALERLADAADRLASAFGAGRQDPLEGLR